MGNADNDSPAVGEQVVDAVRDGRAPGVGAKIVVVDQARRALPGGAGILEVADQFALLGIDADDGQTPPLELVTEPGDVIELLLAMRAARGGQLLAIEAKRVVHGVRRDGDTGWVEQFRDPLRGFASPTPTGDGIAGGVLLQQELDGLN